MRFFLTIIAVALALCTGCAKIPRQSVELSQSVGTGIAESHRAYLAAVNLYFEQKRATIDEWIEKTYLPTFVSNVRTELKTAGKNPDAFDEKLTVGLMRRVVQRRNEMQAGLEKARMEVLDKVEADHALLIEANYQLTALLQSAANVHEARSALADALTNSSGKKINFDGIDKKLNDYLTAAGDVSKPAISLFEELQSVINPK